VYQLPARIRRGRTRGGHAAGAKIFGRGLLTVLAVVLLSACGGGEADEEGADAGARAELVAWMGDFCEARESLLELPSPLPHPGTITEADRQPLLDFLADMDAALAAAEEAVVGLPTPPVAAGSDVVDSYRADLDEQRSQMAEYSVMATAFPPDGLENVYVISGIAAISFLPGGDDLSDYLDGQDDLTQAYQEAPACSGSGTSTTPAA
jgi:hypothetical protein